MNVVWSYLISVVVLISANSTIGLEFGRTKRSYAENFNVLLNLYKINPLRKSKLFKSFSERMLLPRTHIVIDFDSREGEKNEDTMNTIRNLKKIVKVIHPHRSDVENTSKAAQIVIDNNYNTAQDNEIAEFLNFNAIADKSFKDHQDMFEKDQLDVMLPYKDMDIADILATSKYNHLIEEATEANAYAIDHISVIAENTNSATDYNDNNVRPGDEVFR